MAPSSHRAVTPAATPYRDRRRSADESDRPPMEVLEVAADVRETLAHIPIALQRHPRSTGAEVRRTVRMNRQPPRRLLPAAVDVPAEVEAIGHRRVTDPLPKLKGDEQRSRPITAHGAGQSGAAVLEERATAVLADLGLDQACHPEPQLRIRGVVVVVRHHHDVLRPSLYSAYERGRGPFAVVVAVDEPEPAGYGPLIEVQDWVVVAVVHREQDSLGPRGREALHE